MPLAERSEKPTLGPAAGAGGGAALPAAANSSSSSNSTDSAQPPGGTGGTGSGSVTASGPGVFVVRQEPGPSAYSGRLRLAGILAVQLLALAAFLLWRRHMHAVTAAAAAASPRAEV